MIRNFKLSTFYVVIIVVLIVIILFMRSCSPTTDCPEQGKPITTVDTVYVDKIVPHKVYIPGITKYIPGDTVYIKDIDTTAVLNDYFAKRVYDDTIKLEGLGYVLIKDTISQNKIISRITDGKYKIPVIIKETIIPIKPKNQVYVGIDFIGGPPNLLNYVGPSLTLKTKKDKMYSIGAGINSSGYVNYSLRIGWKIKFK